MSGLELIYLLPQYYLQYIKGRYYCYRYFIRFLVVSQNLYNNYPGQMPLDIHICRPELQSLNSSSNSFYPLYSTMENVKYLLSRASSLIKNTNLKRYMHLYVHCSIIYNSQYMETI